MESRKVIITIILIVLAIGVLSVFNTAISTITGRATLDFSGEFPGIGLIFILILGVVGMTILIKHHNTRK